ncbi:MAG: restriction endonuclease subunit S [Bacteroidales bacterium]|nr:restriction endonuclease subunit S [Bacteroidales bacterium]
MMKQGWEYKKLGDCCNIDYGTRVVQKTDGGTIYPVYGGGGETFRMDKYNREDCLIIARFAMSKTCVRYVPGKFFLNDSGLSVTAGDGLLQKYLNHHFVWYNDDIYNLGKGAAQRNLDVKAFKNLTIAIPPLPVQQQIVSELDLLTSIINKKKAQLDELDKLAQATFYDMFGDPVENEKGWVVKKLGEFGKIVTGNTPSRKESKYYSERYIEWIKTDNIVSGKMYATQASEYLSKLGSSVGRIVNEGSVLVACIAGSLSSLGRCCIVDRNVAFNQQINAIELYSDKTNSKYCYWLITISSKYIQKFATTGMKHIISKTIFEDIALPLPPLEVQQAFATRIEAIEVQKAKVKETIENLETLLAATMDKYFG